MKKTLIPILCLLTLAVTRYGGAVVMMGGNATASGSCATSTDYIGNKAEETTEVSSGANTIYVQLYTPAQSTGCTTGNLDNAYILHGLTDTQNVKVCVWVDNGDETPGTADTLVGCTAEITGNADVTWYNSSISGAIDLSKKYWVGFIPGDTAWYRKNGTSGPAVFVKYVAGSYASPPSTLATGFAQYTNKPLSIYVTLGP